MCFKSRSINNPFTSAKLEKMISGISGGGFHFITPAKLLMHVTVFTHYGNVFVTILHMYLRLCAHSNKHDLTNNISIGK